MALEDLTGVKYINALNSSWPEGTDYPNEGDDHLRGLKNVLLRSFPNITGPVLRTQTDLNQGAVPVSAKLLFSESAAPAGWTRVTLGNDYLARVLKSTDGSGGTTGGAHNPVLMDKVPSHTHAVTGNTGSNGISHSHGAGTLAAASGGAHTHGLNARYGNPGSSFNPYGANWLSVGDIGMTGEVSYVTDSGGAHGHTITGSTASQTVDHVHAVSLTSAVNAGSSNWQPRYLNLILCQKSALVP